MLAKQSIMPGLDSLVGYDLSKRVAAILQGH